MKTTCIFENQKTASIEAAAPPAHGRNELPITRDTIFLCKKWQMEGYSPREIAEDILECGEERVKNALSMPLSKFQENKLKKYFNPRKNFTGTKS